MYVPECNLQVRVHLYFACDGFLKSRTYTFTQVLFSELVKVSVINESTNGEILPVLKNGHLTPQYLRKASLFSFLYCIQ